MSIGEQRMQDVIEGVCRHCGAHIPPQIKKRGCVKVFCNTRCQSNWHYGERNKYKRERPVRDKKDKSKVIVNRGGYFQIGRNYKSDKRISKEKIIIVPEMSRDEIFKALFCKYYDALILFAKGIIEDEDVAADMVSEAFLSFNANFKYSNENKAKNFLFISVRCRCRDELKRLRRKSENHEKIANMEQDFDELADAQIVKAELICRVKQSIMKLPRQCKQVIIWLFQDGMTVQEIGKRLKLSDDTVRVQKAKGLKFLKAELSLT